MNISWSDGFNQQPLIDLLRSILKKQKHLSPFDGPSLEALSLLRSMLEFPEDVPWPTRDALIKKGVSAAVKKANWDAKALLQSIQAAAKEHLSKPETKHILYTSLNVAHRALPRSMRVGDVQLTFSSSFPSKVAKARRELISKGSGWMPVSLDPALTSVRATVFVRSCDEAAAKSLDAIDLFRGISNLIVVKGWRRTMNGPTKPVNQILLGPIHSLHTTSGEAATDQFWYEPTFGKSIAFYDPGNQTSDFIKVMERYRSALKQHRYRAQVEQAFIRYARALDLPDHDQAILRLWSLLEYLTDTGRLNYDKTVRRTRFLFKSADHAKLVLDHLRQYRNRSVHAGKGASDVETEVYQLQRYVKAMIQFHVFNGRRFQSIASAAELLDLPPDATKLQSEMALRRYALRLKTSKAV